MGQVNYYFEFLRAVLEEALADKQSVDITKEELHTVADSTFHKAESMLVRSAVPGFRTTIITTPNGVVHYHVERAISKG